MSHCQRRVEFGKKLAKRTHRESGVEVGVVLVCGRGLGRGRWAGGRGGWRVVVGVVAAQVVGRVLTLHTGGGQIFCI
jgi:hypothetical protein